MDKNELKDRIREAEKVAAAAKKKRESKTIAGFAVAYFFGFWFLEGKEMDIRELPIILCMCVFMAVIHFAINYVVYEHLLDEERRSKQLLDMLKKKLEEESF